MVDRDDVVSGAELPLAIPEATHFRVTSGAGHRGAPNLVWSTCPSHRREPVASEGEPPASTH